MLTRHIKAAKVKNVPRGGQRLVKAQKGRRIDAAIALVLAVSEATLGREEEVGWSVYVGGDE